MAKKLQPESCEDDATALELLGCKQESSCKKHRVEPGSTFFARTRLDGTVMANQIPASAQSM